MITVTRSQPVNTPTDGDDPLLMNVLRRRWMLLIFCLLLSTAVGLMAISRFSLPKASSFGQLRYVDLPPTLKDIYQPPGMLEFTEILTSNDIMAKLARRTGRTIGAKELAERFELEAKRFSNIIDVELAWHDGKQAIDMVNELMRIACETMAANRKQTLAHYAVETELQYEAAHQRVVSLRDELMKVRQQRESQLSGEGVMASSAQILLSKIDRAEEALDDLTLRRLAADQQMTTLRNDIEALRKEIKAELLKGRSQQVAARKRLYNPNSDRYRQLEEIERELTEFESRNDGLDYPIWRAKLEAVGVAVIGEMDPASAAAVGALERQLTFKESKLEQMEFETLPMESNRSLLENRRESLERRLTDTLGESDMSIVAVEEAQAQLDEALAARSRLLDQLSQIRRGEETDFNEMTVLTPASWQTTETSEGKAKLFVFTFAGCFVLLVLPVFALEHLYPSGDPAAQAAKALGLPHVSKGTFVTQGLRRDRTSLHAVNSEAMRLLALRIQQCVPGPNSLVLFSGLNHEKSSIPTISYLAECLARREERVLIVDACDRPQDSRSRSANDESVNAVLSTVRAGSRSAPEAAAMKSKNGGRAGDETLPVNAASPRSPGVVGLADFLHHHELRPEQMICATSIPGVDIIPCGSTSFPREGLASSSLTALFDECRERYTMILVAGPSTDYPSDLQMLSARADGILFTVPPNGRSAGQGEAVVRDLLDLGAPVIGIVS